MNSYTYYYLLETSLWPVRLLLYLFFLLQMLHLKVGGGYLFWFWEGKSLKLQKRVFKEANNTKKDWLLCPTTDNRPITIDCNKLTPQVNQVFLIIKCKINISRVGVRRVVGIPVWSKQSSWLFCSWNRSVMLSTWVAACLQPLHLRRAIALHLP